MPKQVFQIGVAVMTDGRLPNQFNVLNISASCGNFQFSQNVIPQRKVTKGLLKPDEYTSLIKGRMSLKDTISTFRQWLSKFPGTLVAYCSAMDWFYLEWAFLTCGKGSPFHAFPMDVNTLKAYQNNKQTPQSIRGTSPLNKAIEHHYLATGERPYVEQSKVKYKGPRPKDLVDYAEMYRLNAGRPIPPEQW